MTAVRKVPKTAWKKGQSGNSRGEFDKRRRRLNGMFLRDMRAVWREKGIQALEDLAEKDPAKFCQIMVAMLPKEASIDVQHDHNHTVSWVQAIQSLPPIGEVIEGKAELPKPEKDAAKTTEIVVKPTPKVPPKPVEMPNASLSSLMFGTASEVMEAITVDDDIDEPDEGDADLD